MRQTNCLFLVHDLILNEQQAIAVEEVDEEQDYDVKGSQ